MASKTLDVALNAKDNMSAAFQKAGNAAKTLGDSLNNIGKDAGSGLQSFANQIKSIDAELNTVGKALTGFGVGITAGVAVGVKQFADLEAAMANVSTIAGQSDAWIDSMTGKLRGLAVELGTSPTGLAEGLYDLIGSGIDAADAFDVLRTSAVAAKAGLTDTGTAARAITSVLNAYGLEASEAGNISDVLFKTVDSGVISFEELANSMGRALPLANILAVGIEELGAAYAELTRQGLTASEAETSFTALLTAAINPTEALTAAVQAYGYESAEAMIRTEGFTAFLQFLDDTAGGSASRMSELTGNVRATNGALILAQDGAAGFTDRLTEMENASGATSAAFERQMDTLNASLARARAGFNDLAITVGASVAPAIDAAASAASGWATVIGSLPDGLQTVASIATAAAGGIALFAGGLLLVVPRVAETVTAIRALHAAMSAGTGATVAFAGALTAAATAGGVLGLFIGAGVGGFIGEFIESIRDGEGALKAFSDSVNVLQAALGKLRSGDVLGFFDTLANGINQASDAMEAFNATASTLLTEAARQTVLGNDEIAKSIEGLVKSNLAAMAEAEVQLRDTEQMHQRIAIQVEATGQTWAQAEQAVRDSMTLTDAEMAVRIEAMNALGQAYLDPTTDAAALNAELASLDAQLASGSITLDEHTAGLVDLARQYGELPNDVQASTDALASMADVASGTGGVLSTLTSTMLENADAAEKERERIQALKEEWIQSALAIGGFDDALSMLNMSGAASDVSLFAESWQTANEALDNTFRVIVGNTNAIISQVDGIQSWADSLIGVRGELGEIDQLLAGGFIDETIYANAQTAYDGIATSVGNIRNNLLAVQAIQAPFIAEAIAGTERWAAELRAMPEDIQRTTLAMMDQATVQQTLDLVNLASAESFALLGDSGRDAWEAMFMGAAQANPMLLETAEAFGFIEQSASGIEFNWDAILSGGDAINQLITQIDNLVDTLRQIHNLPPIAPEVNVAGVQQAQTEIEGVLNTVQQADGTEAYMVMTVNAETGELETAGEIIDSVLSADGQTASVTIETTGGEIVQGVIDMASGDVTMTVNVDVVPSGYSAAAGGAVPGSSMGADAFKAFLGIPDTVETTVTTNLVTTGLDDVTAAQTAIDGITDKSVTVSVNMDATSVGDVLELLDTINTAGTATMTVDVVIGTNELDTGLTQFGIGTGGGGGGAAGYAGQSVTVDIVIGDNALDDLIPDEALTVKVDANIGEAQMQIDSLGGFGDAPAVTVMVDADTSAASEALLGLAAAAQITDGMSVSIPASTPGSGEAIGQLQSVAGAAAAADALSVGIPVTTPGAASGTAALQGVASAGNAADAISVNIPVSVSGASSAIGALNSVANAAASASRTVTINVVTAYSSVGSSGSGFATSQHGGIPSYATGGVLFRAAEGNRPEIAHFAGGGTALLPRDGLYMAPPMTYISPHNSGTSYGGDTYMFNITVEGNVVGVDDLAAEVTPPIMQAIQQATQRRGIAKGLTV